MPVILKPPPRKRLRAFLESQLSLTEMAGESPATASLLRQAVEGLVALDNGEVQDIFVPLKTNAKYTKPFTLLKFKMMALGFVDLLCAKGFEPKAAFNMVGKAHCVGRSAVEHWKAELEKTTEPLLLKCRQDIANSKAWDQNQLTEELKKIATEHLLWKIKKTKVAKEKKKAGGAKKTKLKIFKS